MAMAAEASGVTAIARPMTKAPSISAGALTAV
jgi:hypothetical protein